MEGKPYERFGWKVIYERVEDPNGNFSFEIQGKYTPGHYKKFIDEFTNVTYKVVHEIINDGEELESGG